MNIDAVKDLYNHYHELVKTNPTLYTSRGLIQVVLPEALREYCNAAAGYMSGRPIGIRKRTDYPQRDIAEVFRSVESLLIFIHSSECDYGDRASGILVKKRKTIKRKKTASIARKDFWTKYTKHHLDILKAKFGYSAVLESMNNLTLDQFENKFGLTE